MTLTLDRLRRQAKSLRRALDAGDPEARARIRAVLPEAREDLRHADALHVVAREQGFPSWPKLKLAAETEGMDRAQRRERLKLAIFHGQGWVVDRLLGDDPDLAENEFCLRVSLFDASGVAAMLAADPTLAVAPLGPRRPILHLAFSKLLPHWPEREADMLAIADLLLANGADPNDGFPPEPGSEYRLSALYGAIGHAGNLPLARKLLEAGADPNDGESLYHATELGHREGLRLLLEHGADPRGTNALLRAMDFHDVEAVRLLLEAGADPDEFDDREIGGERPWVVPALFQAARRHSPADMIETLLQAGADPNRTWGGMTAYAAARAWGNRALAAALEARGAATRLTGVETVLAACAEGAAPAGRWIDPATLPPACRDLLRDLIWLPGTMDHIRALIDAGLPWDAPDAEGLTPVQVAGWQGLPERMAYFLSLGPDLSHVNGYGGTLLSTIIHGSENAPESDGQDHIACARLALERGVALPRRAPDLAGEPNMAAFLADWAESYPGQVIDGGPA